MLNLKISLMLLGIIYCAPCKCQMVGFRPGQVLGGETPYGSVAVLLVQTHSFDRLSPQWGQLEAYVKEYDMPGAHLRMMLLYDNPQEIFRMEATLQGLDPSTLNKAGLLQLLEGITAGCVLAYVQAGARRGAFLQYPADKLGDLREMLNRF